MAAKGKYWVLAAMVFAVAMTMIDQTIIAIAVPDIERGLSLSPTGAQWIINSYLLALATLFAFGGKLGDVFGRRQMATVGVVGFAVASALCGLTPAADIAEAWLIVFRAVQGAFAAVLFPAAAGIVIAAFEPNERGRAMAVFFAITGAMMALGPFLGGYLTEWSWRVIFWINIPVAIAALVLIWLSKPDSTTRPAPIDFRGTLLLVSSMALTVLGLQQSSQWGWDSPLTWSTIVIGLILGAVFVRSQLRADHPLLQLRIFKSRGFSVENFALATLSVVYVPFCYFASVYAQVSLGMSPSEAGYYILFFFIGVLVAAQFGGRILDFVGAKPAVLAGSVISAVGLALLASTLDSLSLASQWPWVIATGAGIGLILSSAATDAISQAPPDSFSEATGITQTSRNLGATFGMAVMGTLLITRNEVNVVNALTGGGVEQAKAETIASQIGSGSAGEQLAAISSGDLSRSVELAFANSCATVFYSMAAIMAVTFVVTLLLLPPRKRPEAN